ncbi:MAG TPA: hypothetical protein VKV39_19475 [Candidatus Sulfotelmatobacter sp.]|nr:hypothetical protein [Candidatus Sulfotelmatobacter sp.]
MTLKSALDDLRQTTLAAVSGLLGKLIYLASLRQPAGRYEHWGMKTVHGAESADRALRAAHAEVLAGVLRTPVARLVDDLEESRRGSGVAAPAYIEEMQNRFERLLPGDRTDSPAAVHLSSVLAALSQLERNRSRATRSIS